MSTTNENISNKKSFLRQKQFKISPHNVKFSKNLIEEEFLSGISYDQVLYAIVTKRLQLQALPKIQVIKHNHNYYSTDNKSLYIYRVLNRLGFLNEIDVIIIDKPHDITSNCFGCHIKILKSGNYSKVETLKHCDCTSLGDKLFPDWWNPSKSVISEVDYFETQSLDGSNSSEETYVVSSPDVMDLPSTLIQTEIDEEMNVDDEIADKMQIDHTDDQKIPDSLIDKLYSFNCKNDLQLIPRAGGPSSKTSVSVSESRRSLSVGDYSLDADDNLSRWHDSETRFWLEERRFENNSKGMLSKIATNTLILGTAVGLGVTFYHFYLKEHYPATVSWMWNELDAFVDKITEFWEDEVLSRGIASKDITKTKDLGFDVRVLL